MHLTDEDRRRIGEQIRARREVVFNTRVAAYTAARMNPTTWGKIEAGAVVRDDRLRDAIRALWPDGDGRIEGLLGRSAEAPTGDDGPSLRVISDDALLAEVRRRMMRGTVTSSLPSADTSSHRVIGDADGTEVRADEGQSAARGATREQKAAKASQRKGAQKRTSVRNARR